MVGAEGTRNINELMQWLEEDDAKGRARRARRLQDLLSIMPVPVGGVSYMGGHAEGHDGGDEQVSGPDPRGTRRRPERGWGHHLETAFPQGSVAPEARAGSDPEPRKKGRR